MIEEAVSKAETTATRVASKKTLECLVPRLPELVGGSADLTGSVGTLTSSSEHMDVQTHKGNYVSYGVREFGMPGGLVVAVPSIAPGGPDAAPNAHFGRCQFYTLARVEDGKIGEVNIQPNPMGIVRRNSTKLVAEGKFDEATALFSAEYGPQFRKLAPVYAELVNLTTRSSKENMLDAIALGIMAKNTGLVLSLIAVVISIIITYLLTRSVMRQLGKDPGQLNSLARRVVDGDYEIADGSARIGVYDSIVSMVESLKDHMEKAHNESLNAQNQAAKATEAMRNAEESGKIAQSKSSAMLVAAAQLEEVAHVRQLSPLSGVSFAGWRRQAAAEFVLWANLLPRRPVAE